MPPLFTWTLRGHCWIINWPTFNIVVSQEIGRAKERERDGWTAGRWVEQSEHTHLLIKFTVFVGMVCEPYNNYNSSIEDHWSQIIITNIIIMKKFEILQEFPKWDIERHEVSKFCWENGTNGLAWCRVATSVQFLITISVKCNKTKHNKARYACREPNDIDPHVYSVGLLTDC